MARLALAVGYVSRATSRSEQPVQLYLGTSFQAAKEAAASPPAGIGYTEAYRLDAGPNKRQHFDTPAAGLDLDLPAFLTEKPAAPEPLADPEPEAPAGESAPEPEAEPDLDLGTPSKRGPRKP